MIKFINPKDLGKEPAMYSHGILVSFAQCLFIAGQVAMNDQGEIIGKEDIGTQTVYIMENLKKILAEAEMDFDNVIKVNMYLLNMDNLPKVLAVRNSYLQPNRPATTTVEITKLVKSDLLVEIEAIAIK